MPFSFPFPTTRGHRIFGLDARYEQGQSPEGSRFHHRGAPRPMGARAPLQDPTRRRLLRTLIALLTRRDVVVAPRRAFRMGGLVLVVLLFLLSDVVEPGVGGLVR